jgi:hypothetical protein
VISAVILVRYYYNSNPMLKFIAVTFKSQEPPSVDAVFWSGRRYMLGSSALPTRIGLISAWAEAVTTTPWPLSLSRPISLPDRKRNRSTVPLPLARGAGAASRKFP